MQCIATSNVPHLVRISRLCAAERKRAFMHWCNWSIRLDSSFRQSLSVFALSLGQREVFAISIVVVGRCECSAAECTVFI